MYRHPHLLTTTFINTSRRILHAHATHTNINMHVHSHTPMRMFTSYVRACMTKHRHTCTNIRKYKHAHPHKHTSICSPTPWTWYISMRNLHTCTHTHTHTHTNTQKKYMRMPTWIPRPNTWVLSPALVTVRLDASATLFGVYVSLLEFLLMIPAITWNSTRTRVQVLHL